MPNPTQTSTLPTGDVLMQSRKVAMSMDGMWRVTDFAKLGIHWGVGVLPMFKKPVTMLLSTPKVIFSQTKFPKQTFEFYSYISDPAQVGLFKSGLWAPNGKVVFYRPGEACVLGHGQGRRLSARSDGRHRQVHPRRRA